MNIFWIFNLKYFKRIYLTLKLYSKKNNEYLNIYQIGFLCIFMIIILIFSILNLIKYFSMINYFNTFQIYSIYKSRYLSSDEKLILNIYNHSINYIYIDIGCFNGETIEHFIHFNPNSIYYDIITFEPDPINYQLCKQKFLQKKYRNYNINIIPKVVWIRNEKLSYQINLGEKSRIDLSKNSYAKLDAIDFSSWLKQIIPLNNTKLYIKLSTPGIEVILLEKMINDETLTLADQWEVEWTDRSNPRTQPVRYYIQSMFDSLGYDWTYLTCLSDRRKVFQMNGTYANITKYRNMEKIAHLEIFFHYIQRPVITERPRIISILEKFNKF